MTALGWSPARLARAVNSVLGPDYVARTTVTDWVAKGRVPRDPLPTITAHVLSEALGRPIALADLWGPGVRPSTSWVRADDGLLPPDAPGATVEAATQWVIHDGGDMERRKFLAVSSAALTSTGLNSTPTRASAELGRPIRGPAVTEAVVDVIAATVDAVRQLDDAAGGNRSSLHHAHRQFALVAEYVRNGRFTTSAVRDRAINLWGQLAQTAGWMAMDAGLHGLAQRYFSTGLAAAHDSDDPALASHLHGCLTYQAVTLGRFRDAVSLANAGIDAASAAPPAVRALAAARHAHAHAALGDVHGMRQSTEEAHRHLAHTEALQSRPPWLYWLTDLNVVTGQTLITAAFAEAPGAPRLLDEADPLITPWLGTHAERTEDRDALLHGAWLARSYLRRHDLEQTIATADSLVQYASTVHSKQVEAALRGLELDLAQRPDLRHHQKALDLRKRLKVVAFPE
ncbi:hypothetical protein ACH4E8_06570 [Streptomyces sp. NPDC017979]|uniref:hypothetical protein n=1 Tax=Streptomyces sp. NPDC017979 TaxID=3365024 RepID=UPI00379B15FE